MEASDADYLDFKNAALEEALAADITADAALQKLFERHIAAELERPRPVRPDGQERNRLDVHRMRRELEALSESLGF